MAETRPRKRTKYESFYAPLDTALLDPLSAPQAIPIETFVRRYTQGMSMALRENLIDDKVRSKYMVLQNDIKTKKERPKKKTMPNKERKAKGLYDLAPEELRYDEIIH